MVDLELFLGTSCTEELNSSFLKSKTPLMGVFVGDNPDYLQKIETSEGVFIGKRIGKEVDLETLGNAERNIYSLLKRLAPQIPKISLVLFPVIIEK